MSLATWCVAESSDGDEGVELSGQDHPLALDDRDPVNSFYGGLVSPRPSF